MLPAENITFYEHCLTSGGFSFVCVNFLSSQKSSFGSAERINFFPVDLQILSQSTLEASKRTFLVFNLCIPLLVSPRHLPRHPAPSVHRLALWVLGRLSWNLECAHNFIHPKLPRPLSKTPVSSNMSRSVWYILTAKTSLPGQFYHKETFANIFKTLSSFFFVFASSTKIQLSYTRLSKILFLSTSILFLPS